MSGTLYYQKQNGGGGAGLCAGFNGIWPYRIPKIHNIVKMHGLLHALLFNFSTSHKLFTYHSFNIQIVNSLSQVLVTFQHP